MSFIQLVSLLFILDFQIYHADSIKHKIIPIEEYAQKMAESATGETARILKGHNATQNQFPFAVALYYYNQYICTGSLIANNVILTAAHCVFMNGTEFPASAMIAVLGNVNRSLDEKDSVKREFKEILIHPDYNETNLDNDIALVKIENVTLNEKNISTICIANSGTYNNQYQKGTVMGWGRTSQRTDVPLPEILQYKENKILPQSTCESRHSANSVRISEKQMCADGFTSGICDGDSGGPMIYECLLKERVQIGIASFILENPGCGSFIMSPPVLTRVAAYADWIEGYLKNNSGFCTD